jgi:hypothetical protein
MPLLRVSAQCFGARVNHLNGGQRCVRAPPESPATDAAT